MPINALTGQRIWFILNAQLDQTGLFCNHTVAFWLQAPAGRIVPRLNFVSSVPPQSQVPWGIISAELTLLQAGTLVEQVIPITLPASTLTQVQLVNVLDAAFNSLQQQLNATAQTQIAPHLPGMFLGADGATVTAGP